MFRFKNHWNYYFRGEIKDFKYIKEVKSGKYLYTESNIVTQTLSGEKKMISGIIRQYSIDELGKLQNIYLSHARKWSSREPDSNNEEDLRNLNSKGKISFQKTIESDCFIIPYSSILEMNLNYRMVRQLEVLPENDIINEDQDVDRVDVVEERSDRWMDNAFNFVGLSVIVLVIYYLFIYDILICFLILYFNLFCIDWLKYILLFG